VLENGRLFADVLPFMAGLRARGIKIAIVSNCDEQARGLLGWQQPNPSTAWTQHQEDQAECPFPTLAVRDQHVVMTCSLCTVTCAMCWAAR